VVLQEGVAADADLIIVAHALAAISTDDAVRGAFDDLTAIAAREQRPRAVVALGPAIGAGRLAAAGVDGLVRTAAREWNATWLCIGLSDDAPAASTLADELAYGGGAREARPGAIRQERVGALAQHPGDSAVATSARALPAGPWIVSGGGRGVTAACCVALARAGMRDVVLLGRSALVDEPAACRDAHDEGELKRALLAAAAGRPNLAAVQREAREILARREVRTTIATLESLGARVRYETVDVADADGVATLVADVRATWGPIRGIVHGAGVLADKGLGDKTPEQFRTVMRPKLDGARALLDACAADPLEVLCFFSSVAAHSGNPGQSDYAAANAMLDAWAEAEAEKRGAACRVVSVAWGPWDGGMVTPSLAKHFAAQGVELIPVDEGSESLVAELTRGDSPNVILGCGLDGAEPERASTIRFDIDREPWLRDHAIAGTVVVPMTLALDWLMAGGARRVGGPVELRDLALVRGILVRDGSAELRLATTRNADGSHAVVLEHLDGHAAYKATVVASSPTQTPVTPGQRLIDLRREETLPECCVEPYAEALFHGPAFQVIREVLSCGSRGIVARLATARLMGWPDGWQADPAALDGALQLIRVWGWAGDGRSTLPTAIGRCARWGEWPREEIVCTVSVTRENAFRLRGDARFTDPETGRLVAVLEGIVMHAHGG
jgi:NAD(P)-dependent dehydrogenase (short-subunit alcohol dehydrogenase family)